MSLWDIMENDWYRLVVLLLLGDEIASMADQR